MLLLVYIGFDKKPLLFDSPKEIISCHDPAGIKLSFDKMESMLDKGYYLAGFLSYEAGYGLEDKFVENKNYSFPLICMGCYKKPEEEKIFLKNHSGGFKIQDARPSLSFNEYSGDISSIREHIAAGDVYQITYCMKMKFSFEGAAVSLFNNVLKEHPMPYPAYIESGPYKILSLSPEMFVKKKGISLKTKPMKGTWHRGNNVLSDLYARLSLKYDEKNRAENIMITDLLRNDLGRIGSNVRVPRLFEVSSYATLFQMTSSVDADLNKDVSLYDLFKAIFPSGSVTGAPKVRAMEIIRGLEKEERKIYTGAIGYITPKRDIFFNVPIRTILLENGVGEMGVGGGIIWDSTAKGEWDESLLKARFLTDRAAKI